LPQNLQFSAVYIPASPIRLQPIQEPLFHRQQVRVSVLRLDEIHPTVSGNKFFKLKYNLLHALENKAAEVITFGGQYSNHIYSTAAACKLLGIKAIGIIGAADQNNLTPTLLFAKAQGMELQFTDRTTYRQKNDQWFIEDLLARYPGACIIPEGGSNQLAVRGCAEIPALITAGYDVLCTAAGTGGTLAGLAVALGGQKQLIGFSSLKGPDTLTPEVTSLIATNTPDAYSNWHISTGYHFGGYAKAPAIVMDFIHRFKERHGIQLEQVYTAKMMMGIYDLVEQGYFPQDTQIVAVHSGGLQGLLQ
jgi:1-aminocyclopropane-1-carboxylate deaminase